MGDGALELGPKASAAEAETNASNTTDYQDYPKMNQKINSSHEVREQNFQLKTNTIHTPQRSPSSLSLLIEN
jgi:hypothetical protein